MNSTERNSNRIIADKRPGYVLEPLTSGQHALWEGHHATNPTAIRLTADPRVFLGYRAGGIGDRYCIGPTVVWGSHLGLAVLDPRGERVQHRLPLPIFTIRRDVKLPTTEEEFEAYQAGPHCDEIVVLHDFRFWEDDGWLHLIYHEGTITKAYDCVVRMRVEEFLTRVAESIQLAEQDPSGERLESDWRRIWWAPGVWEPCGVSGTNRIYPSEMHKNDIVYLRLQDGTLLMYHRPVPDIAVVKTAGVPYLRATEDGITEIGTLQTCIRPGYRDNSHIGNNGVPTAARVGEVPVAIDVVHGVFNETVADGTIDRKWKLLYYPYLRILDARDGSCLYYSREPLLEYGGVWDEYARNGEWVRAIPHLDGVMFAGGQVEVDPGRNGVDDLFRFYTGVGDTAVAAADFRLRDVVPPEVIEDIRATAVHPKARAYGVRENRYRFPGLLSGWSFTLRNDTAEPDLLIGRDLEGREQADRSIGLRPGSFDAHDLYFDGRSVEHFEGLGWIVQYLGGRRDSSGGWSAAVGVLLLDSENPERILYRAEEPVQGSVRRIGANDPEPPAYAVAMSVDLVPEHVRREVARIIELRPMPSDMTRWLLRKSRM